MNADSEKERIYRERDEARDQLRHAALRIAALRREVAALKKATTAKENAILRREATQYRNALSNIAYQVGRRGRGNAAEHRRLSAPAPRLEGRAPRGSYEPAVLGFRFGKNGGARMTAPIDELLDAVDWRELPQPHVSMSGDPYALYATHEGVLTVGGIEWRCYVLNDGQRVFDAESFLDAALNGEEKSDG